MPEFNARLSLAQQTNEQTNVGFATAVEVAYFLRLSRAGVHKLIKDGVIPSKRFGKAIRVPWAWLRSQAGE